jgi:hypothetical protein
MRTGGGSTAGADDAQERDRHHGEEHAERRLGREQRAATDAESEAGKRGLLPAPQPGCGGKLRVSGGEAMHRLVEFDGARRTGCGKRINPCAANMAANPNCGARTQHDKPLPPRV